MTVSSISRLPHSTGMQSIMSMSVNGTFITITGGISHEKPLTSWLLNASPTQTHQSAGSKCFIFSVLRANYCNTQSEVLVIPKLVITTVHLWHEAFNALKQSESRLLYLRHTEAGLREASVTNHIIEGRSQETRTNVLWLQDLQAVTL